MLNCDLNRIDCTDHLTIQSVSQAALSQMN
jgi:hypothetical protein